MGHRHGGGQGMATILRSRAVIEGALRYWSLSDSLPRVQGGQALEGRRKIKTHLAWGLRLLAVRSMQLHDWKGIGCCLASLFKGEQSLGPEKQNDLLN